MKTLNYNPVHALISSNIQVILPIENREKNIVEQLPFHLGYRIVYLFFTWIIVSYILSRYATLMNGLLPEDHIYREYLVCGGQLFFQGVVISFVDQHKRWAYLGNMMTISFAGALLLLPALLIAQWFVLPTLFYAGWFLAVAGLMFLEHIRRSKLLKIGWMLTISWVVYRLIVLLIILL